MTAQSLQSLWSIPGVDTVSPVSAEFLPRVISLVASGLAKHASSCGEFAHRYGPRHSTDKTYLGETGGKLRKEY